MRLYTASTFNIYPHNAPVKSKIAECFNEKKKKKKSAQTTHFYGPNGVIFRHAQHNIPYLGAQISADFN